jgi:hypothetical protein
MALRIHEISLDKGAALLVFHSELRGYRQRKNNAMDSECGDAQTAVS